MSSPSPVSGIPWILRLHILEYCSRLSHSLCRSSTCSSSTVILHSLPSSCDVRPAIVCVSVSSLFESAYGYNADLSFRTTWSSLSSSRNLSSITSVSQTLLSVTLDDFLALGMLFHQLCSPTKSAVLCDGSHLAIVPSSAVSPSISHNCFYR